MNTLKTRIKLRRDTESNFNKVADTLLLLQGEVVIVDTKDDIRLKIGDGINLYKDLPFIDENLIKRINNIIVRGYFYNDEFYIDKQHREKCVPYENKIYIDNDTHCVYCWDATACKYYTVVAVPGATDKIPGIMKLYNEHGENIDGTMTQKSISIAMDNIKFKLDDGEPECLILGAPW